MVLDEAVSGSSDSFATSTSDAPTNDRDPFAQPTSDDPQTIHYEIDTSKLSRPVPVLGPLLGYSVRGAVLRTQELVANVYKVGTLKRPITQEEYQALAEHQALSLRITSVGGSIGLLAGMRQAYKTREQFKFPFIKVAEPGTIDMNKFGPLRGNAALWTRHVMRYSSYVALGVLLGDMVFQGYATANMASGIMKDERLEDFVQTLRQRASQVTQRPRPNQEESEGAFEAEQSQNQQSSRGGSLFGRKATASDDDDMSPKASFDSDMLSDKEMRVREREEARARQKESQASNVQTERGRPQPQSRNDDDAFFGSNPAPSQSPVSAWDRVRISASGRGSWQSRDQEKDKQQGSSGGNSFSFSSSDEKRQLAQTEAQKEFDAKIERERRGGDFEDRGKRW